MIAGAQTFVLILQLVGAAVSVPGYATKAECDAALVVAKSHEPKARGFCVPGPVEERR